MSPPPVGQGNGSSSSGKRRGAAPHKGKLPPQSNLGKAFGKGPSAKQRKLFKLSKVSYDTFRVVLRVLLLVLRLSAFGGSRARRSFFFGVAVLCSWFFFCSRGISATYSSIWRDVSSELTPGECCLRGQRAVYSGAFRL